MARQQRHAFSATGLVAMLVFAGCSGGGGGAFTSGSDPPPPSLRVSDINVVEGNSGTSNAVFPVQLSAAAAATVTVSYATRDGSALAGSDYTVSSGSLSFAPGETSKNVTVTVQGDTLEESDEQFFLTLTNPAGATLGVSEARAILVNDDGPLSGLDGRPANTSCVAPPRPVAGAASIALQDAFPGLGFASPLALLQAPGDSSRWYVIQKTGGMLIIGNLGGTPTETTLADLSGLVDSRSEGGLLGMAFHPDYAQNGHIYLSYTTSDNAGSDNGANFRSRISRFTLTGGGSVLDLASERNVLTLAQPYDNHNGGQIAFGPDGYLYIGFGDGGSGGDPQGNGQNTHTLLGAMLRIDVNVTDQEYNAGTRYKIPADNPFAASPGCGASTNCPEIYAWGLRNPWRWSFDRATGDLWAGDVGQDTWEEIDRIERGGNYGWNIREGAHCYNAASCSIAGLIEPVAEYGHTNGRCSVTGGYVYRGSAMPALQGTYLYGDFCTGEIWGLGSQSGATPQLLASGALMLASFAEGHDGELYALGYEGGAHIYRITSGTPAPAFPGRLSESGCVNPANPAEPASGLVAYDVNVPFWSDGAIKERYLALPDGNTLHINAGHDWEFPIGSVFMKHFRLGGRLIETRLFMRHPDGEWGGYSYEWDDAQTDAILVSGGKTKTINGQTWRYPSGSECLRCHSAAAGRALGPETAQMNRYFTYPGTGRSANQLTTLDFIGMFDAPLADIPANLPALAVVTDVSQTLTARARAYLHANCSNCHRPGGPTPVNLDFRHTTSLSGTNACDVAPANGDLGVANARLIAPGDPARSVLPLRMRATDSNRMPPLASSVVDGDGAVLIESWIASLAGCQ